ncbi:MAG: 50S ribosomal protein L10 [Thermoplasmata archaeon]|nr:MAG: 50S ribosomal protein L10 [Thermoplasmata archaeon]
MPHVAKWKTDEVKQLVEIINSKPVIGLVNITNIPSPQIQTMRKKLRGKAIMRISKNRLFKLALEKCSENKSQIEKLIEKLDGQMALIATDMNPFKLYRDMELTKTKAPAKGGEESPEDIEVKAGETSFKPGPIVGELQRVGIPASIESGKVVIKKDKVLVKKGEVITPETAQILKKLEIFPLIIGLDLCGVHEDGVLYPLDVLKIDIDEIKDKFTNAAVHNFNLAMNIGFMTKQTAVPLIQKAHHDAFALAVNANIYSKESLPHLLAKAHQQMQSIKSKVK